MNEEHSRPTVRVDFEELRFAMDDASYEHHYFLDTETGEVILVSEYDDDEESTQRLEAIDEAEPGRYLQVPRAESSDGYADMQAFIDTVSDKPLQELLAVAIQGKGAFRRFKDVLARDPAEQQRWFAFQMERLNTRVREWLDDEHLQGAGGGREHEVWVTERRQIDAVDAIREMLQQLLRTCDASRVLPVPPAPVSVSMRTVEILLPSDQSRRLEG